MIVGWKMRLKTENFIWLRYMRRCLNGYQIHQISHAIAQNWYLAKAKVKSIFHITFEYTRRKADASEIRHMAICHIYRREWNENDLCQYEL